MDCRSRDPHLTGASAIITAIAEVLPGVLPVRWSTGAATGVRLDEHGVAGLGSTVATVSRGRRGYVIGQPRRPFLEFQVRLVSCLGERERGESEVRSLAIDVAGSVLAQPGWGRHLARAFTAISETIRPFYGEARLVDCQVDGRYVHETSRPIDPGHWYGFPHEPPLAMVVGPPYRDRWNRHGGTYGRGLIFYTSDTWPDQPSGGIPLAPNGLLQHHDIRFKEVDPRLIPPDLTAAATVDAEHSVRTNARYALRLLDNRTAHGHRGRS